MKKTRIYFLLFIIMIASSNYSCEKFLEIGSPKDRASPVEMFSSDAMAASAITGIYSRMANSGGFSGNQNSISVLAGLSADELKGYSSALDVFYRNEIPTTNSTIQNRLWQEPYSYIYTTNAILEGLKGALGISESVNKQLQGEAKFIRAFCYFYLVNLFGEVPLVLTTDYRANELIPKSSTDKVYDQIIADLIDAESLLSNNYITGERVRPNKWAATALLARVYLYLEKWDLAGQKASEIIDQKNMYSLVDNLDAVFIKNSNEAIWQLMPTTSTNTKEGALFVLIATPTQVSLSPDLLTFFESGDNRRSKWIAQYSNSTGIYYYPFKYKIRATASGVVNEYSMVIRLAEIYLIRAEARAKLFQTATALEDINLIRKRSGLATALVGLNQAQCLTEIDKQRRLELFSEWGHRWLDLKRTGKTSATLAALKGGTWKDTDVLYPIPENEIIRNPSITQNLGY